MDIWKRLATYIVVTATKDGNQDEILTAHETTQQARRGTLGNPSKGKVTSQSDC